MKQQTYLLLLLLTIINVGRSYSYGHGVKGAFSNSYSSSSASASSSAFSGSFSSDPLELENAKNNIKFGTGAISSAAANADSNGANSGAYAGSGAFSNSGSYSGTAGPHNTGSGYIPVAVSSSGAISGASGSHNAGAGIIPVATSDSGASGFHKVGPGLIPVPERNLGPISGGASYNSGSGSHNAGAGFIPVANSDSGAISGGSGFHKVGPGLLPVPERNSGPISGGGSYNSGSGSHNVGAGIITVATSDSGAISGGGSYNSGSGFHNSGAGFIPVATSDSGAISGASGFHKVGPGLLPVPERNSGAISGGGSYNSGSGSHNAGAGIIPVATSDSGASGFHKVGPGLIPVPERNSGAISGTGSYNSGQGAISGAESSISGFPEGGKRCGGPNQKCSLENNQGVNLGSGSYNSRPGVGLIPVATGGSGAISGAGSYNSASGFPRDENFSGTRCGGANQKCGLENNQGSYLGSGSVPKPTTVVEQNNGANGYSDTNNNQVRYNGNINNTPNKIFINDLQIPEEFPPIRGLPKPQFPGPQGNINDYKPIGQNPQIPAQVPNFTPSGSNANSLNPGSCKNCKGPFPGPKGNIYDYKPAPQGGGGPPAWVPEEQTQPPLVRPSPNVFNQFPGSTGSIYDSKPVMAHQNIPVVVVGHQNKPTYNQEVQTKPGSIAVSVIGKLPGPTGNIHDSVNPKDQKPVPSPGNIPSSGCSNGQCNIQPDCTKGQCDEYGGRLGCHGDDCFGPGKKPSGNVAPGINKPDCSKGQCNIDGTYYPEKSIPGTPGKVCSGSECLKVAPQVNIDLNDDKNLDFNIDIRQKPDNLDYQQPMCFGSYCKQVPQVDVQIEQKPNDIPLEADFPKQVPTSTIKTPGSMDFLLPGNKPYHHHVIKHHPKPKPDTYYQCTGESCPLPKPIVPQLTPNKNCEGLNCRQGPYYTCSGSSCPLPKPVANCQGGVCGVPERTPGCQGSQCGAGGKDRLFPVMDQGNPGNNKFQGQYAGSAANAGANSFKGLNEGDIALPGTGHLPVEYPSQNLYKGNNNDDRQKQGCSKGTCQLIPDNLDLNSQGYVAGNVIVQKSNGAEVPVIEVVIPNIHHQQPQNNGEYSGSFSGSSGQQGHGSGYKSEGGLCGNGNCGNGINAGAAQSGSYSGVKGGCKNGNCGSIPVGGSSYSGSSAFSGSSSFDGGHLRPESTFKTIKDLLSQKIKETGFVSGNPGGFGGAGSFSHSGAASSSFGSSSAYSGAYSSAGSSSY